MLQGNSRQIGRSDRTDALGRPILTGSIYDPFTLWLTMGSRSNHGPDCERHWFHPRSYAGNIVPQANWDAVSQPSFREVLARANQTGHFISARPRRLNLIRMNTRSASITTLTDNTRLFGRWSRKYESKVNVPRISALQSGWAGATTRITGNNATWVYTCVQPHVHDERRILGSRAG